MTAQQPPTERLDHETALTRLFMAKRLAEVANSTFQMPRWRYGRAMDSYVQDRGRDIAERMLHAAPGVGHLACQLLGPSKEVVRGILDLTKSDRPSKVNYPSDYWDRPDDVLAAAQLLAVGKETPIRVAPRDVSMIVTPDMIDLTDLLDSFTMYQDAYLGQARRTAADDLPLVMPIDQ